MNNKICLVVILCFFSLARSKFSDLDKFAREALPLTLAKANFTDKVKHTLLYEIGNDEIEVTVIEEGQYLELDVVDFHHNAKRFTHKGIEQFARKSAPLTLEGAKLLQYKQMEDGKARLFFENKNKKDQHILQVKNFKNQKLEYISFKTIRNYQNFTSKGVKEFAKKSLPTFLKGAKLVKSEVNQEKKELTDLTFKKEGDRFLVVVENENNETLSLVSVTPQKHTAGDDKDDDMDEDQDVEKDDESEEDEKSDDDSEDDSDDKSDDKKEDKKDDDKNDDDKDDKKDEDKEDEKISKVEHHHKQPKKHEIFEHHHIVLGGYQKLKVQKLPKDAEEVDQFLRKEYPELKQADIVSVQRQVVAGFNYKFHYHLHQDQEEDWKFVVFRDLHDKLSVTSKPKETQPKEDHSHLQLVEGMNAVKPIPA